MKWWETHSTGAESWTRPVWDFSCTWMNQQGGRENSMCLDFPGHLVLFHSWKNLVWPGTGGLSPVSYLLHELKCRGWSCAGFCTGSTNLLGWGCCGGSCQAPLCARSWSTHALILERAGCLWMHRVPVQTCREALEWVWGGRWCAGGHCRDSTEQALWILCPLTCLDSNFPHSPGDLAPALSVLLNTKKRKLSTCLCLVLLRSLISGGWTPMLCNTWSLISLPLSLPLSAPDTALGKWTSFLQRALWHPRFQRARIPGERLWTTCQWTVFGWRWRTLSRALKPSRRNAALQMSKHRRVGCQKCWEWGEEHEHLRQKVCSCTWTIQKHVGVCLEYYQSIRDRKIILIGWWIMPCRRRGLAWLGFGFWSKAGCKGWSQEYVQGSRFFKLPHQGWGLSVRV